MNVVQMLERLRKHGLTETRIAAELGVSPSTVNKLRRGIIKNSSHSLVRGIELLYQIILFQQCKLKNTVSAIQEQESSTEAEE